VAWGQIALTTRQTHFRWNQAEPQMGLISAIGTANRGMYHGLPVRSEDLYVIE
jgi:hypothetical protein